MTTTPFDQVVAVIPALDEEHSIAAVVTELRAQGISLVIVADNGSTDATIAVATAAGATVVRAQRRGYGSACLVGLAAVPQTARAVVFCDADGADDLSLLSAIITPVVTNQCDVVIGSRVLGHAETGALTPQQRMGNLVAAGLMRLLYGQRVTDLGPFRCVSTAALKRLQMSDPAFGWTAEMQVKSFRLSLRVCEIPVNAKVRTAGESKISGRWWPVLRAGWGIISTILYYWRVPMKSEKASVGVQDTLRDVETCDSCVTDPVNGK
jgi:glycosyltransferase involved in cell wall biosynthesis